MSIVCPAITFLIQINTAYFPARFLRSCSSACVVCTLPRVLPQHHRCAGHESFSWCRSPDCWGATVSRARWRARVVGMLASFCRQHGSSTPLPSWSAGANFNRHRSQRPWRGKKDELISICNFFEGRVSICNCGPFVWERKYKDPR